MVEGGAKGEEGEVKSVAVIGDEAVVFGSDFPEGSDELGFGFKGEGFEVFGWDFRFVTEIENLTFVSVGVVDTDGDDLGKERVEGGAVVFLLGTAVEVFFEIVFEVVLLL